MINPLIDMFDYIFWAGDMNFRINSTREIVDGLLRHDMHEELLHNDELTMLLQFNPMFTGYREGPLNFRPTYKFRKGTGNSSQFFLFSNRSFQTNLLVL